MGTSDDELPPKPVKPILPRQTVQDATAEALAPILKENPRGVAVVWDELTGLVNSFNQHKSGGKGNDRQFYLSCWAGKTATVDRKGTHDKGPLRVRKPFLGIVGGLTPDNLVELRGDSGNRKAKRDGWIDRFLLAYPAELPYEEENWKCAPEHARQDLAVIFKRLRALEMLPVHVDGKHIGYRPFILNLTGEARLEWQKFTREHSQELNAEDFPPHLKGPWSKLRGYCGRFAVLIHCLRRACGETDDDNSPVDGESVRRAAALIRYFKSHARKIYTELEADPRIALARKMLKWIVGQSKPTFTRRDLHQANRGTIKSVDSLDEILDLLEKHFLIRSKGSVGRIDRGRKPSPTYELNPKLLETPAQNTQNAQNSISKGEGGDNATK
jgi:Protein of unknown function (DUF3987)